jgi:hypothetical protein
LRVPKHNTAITQEYTSGLASRPAGMSEGGLWSETAKKYVLERAYPRAAVQTDRGLDLRSIKVIYNNEIPLNSDKQPVCQVQPGIAPRQQSYCVPQPTDSPASSAASAAYLKSVLSQASASMASSKSTAISAQVSAWIFITSALSAASVASAKSNPPPPPPPPTTRTQAPPHRLHLP